MFSLVSCSDRQTRRTGMTAIAVCKKTLAISNISCPNCFKATKRSTCILSVTYRQLFSVSVPLVPKCQTCPNFLKTHQYSRFRFLKPAAWRRHDGGRKGGGGGGVSSTGNSEEIPPSAGTRQYVQHLGSIWKREVEY